MRRSDPLDQKIARTLETVAADVPVRDRLAEFGKGPGLPKTQGWRLADRPALAGVVAFVIGIALVGGVLIALRGTTNEPGGPSETASTTAISPDGLWLMSMNDCDGDCDEPAVMFGDTAYLASCDPIDASAVGDPIAVADPESVILVPYELARPIAELDIDRVVALGPNAPAWCDETLGDWWAARSIDYLYDESLDQAIASLAPNREQAATSSGTDAASAGGPCLDERDNYVGVPGIQVRSGDQVVEGSFGYDSIGYCPGHPAHGNRVYAGDGFFMDLDATLLEVEPGDELILSAPGYPGATVDVSWSVDNVIDSSSTAVLTPTGETTWVLDAPDDAELYRLSVRLEWFEGDASYAILVTTGAVTPEEGAVVSIEPVGDPYIHPTVVPFGFVGCGTEGSPLRFCDPERDQRWFEVEIQVGSPVPEWQFDLADRLRGAIKMSEGPRIYGIYIGPDTFLTVTASGVEHLALIATIESIPAFDAEVRAAECAATSPEELPEYSWKCDLSIQLPGSSETNLTRFVEIVGQHALGHTFTPTLPRGGGPTPMPIVTYGPGDPWAALDKWKDDMVRASEELGFDPAPVTDGTYVVDDVILFVFPETPRDVYADVLDELHDSGFLTEMVLRERF